MKKLIASAMIALVLLSGCGHPMTANGKEYPTYGLFNESSSKSKDVCYEISIGNVVWSILLIESIVFPVYFVGFSIYNPVRMKRDASDDCSI